MRKLLILLALVAVSVLGGAMKPRSSCATGFCPVMICVGSCPGDCVCLKEPLEPTGRCVSLSAEATR